MQSSVTLCNCGGVMHQVNRWILFKSDILSWNHDAVIISLPRSHKVIFCAIWKEVNTSSSAHHTSVTSWGKHAESRISRRLGRSFINIHVYFTTQPTLMVLKSTTGWSAVISYLLHHHDPFDSNLCDHLLPLWASEQPAACVTEQRRQYISCKSEQSQKTPWACGLKLANP